MFEMTQLHWYRYLRPLLFTLPPEFAHQLVLKCLDYAPRSCFKVPQTAPISAMGINFPHRVGLAAGFDNNALHLRGLAKLGFAFIEVGGVTPKPQAGNPVPRLFRLPAANALINRMGFKNCGVDKLVENIRDSNYEGILGVNIAKNKNTLLNQAIEDYRYCLRAVYPYASYITLNVSSPNTPDLRRLQYGDYFANLIKALSEEQNRLGSQQKKEVPLVVKVSPDETDETLKRMAQVLLQYNIAGIIATNTTRAREGVLGLRHAGEEGGLSGAPLKDKALKCLRLLKQEVGDAITLIAAGGIDSSAAAKERINAGAALVQVYTGLIYEGPRLITEITRGLAE